MENLGIKITYQEQNKPKGLPDAFILGEKFIGTQNVAMILGDNFFYGQGLSENLKKCTKLKSEQKYFTQGIEPRLIWCSKSK